MSWTGYYLNRINLLRRGEILEGKFEQIKTIANKNPQILISGNGYNVAKVMKDIAERLHKAEADYIDQKVREELGVTDTLSMLTTSDILSAMSMMVDESTFEPLKQDISSLKKRIKHCKNHMERQRLQKELNALYKEQKRKR